MINYTFTLSKRRKNNQFFRKTSKNIKSFSWGFPGGPVVKTTLPFQGGGFNPWLGKFHELHHAVKKKKNNFS